MKCDAHPGLALGSAVFAVDWFDSFTNKQREIERLCERTVPVLPSPTLAGKVGASIAERTCYGNSGAVFRARPSIETPAAIESALMSVYRVDLTRGKSPA